MAPERAFLSTPRQLLVAAVACAAAFIGVLAVAYGSDQAATVDAAALEDFGKGLRTAQLARAADWLVHLADPAPFALATAALVLLALMLRGVRVAAAVGVMIAAANVSTQLLKPLLATPRGTVGGWTIGPEAFPSGHSTAAMSLALAAVVISSRGLRPAVALAGAAFAIGVGFSLVATDSHFPSDVAGGYLMAAGWCFGVRAGLAALERRRPGRRPPEDSGSLAAAAGLLVALSAVAALGAAQLPDLVDHARGHTAFAVVAAATAALAALLVAATAASSSSATERA